MIVDRTNLEQPQRGIWGHQQSYIAPNLVDTIDDGVYDPVCDVLQQIENMIEMGLEQTTRSER